MRLLDGANHVEVGKLIFEEKSIFSLFAQRTGQSRTADCWLLHQ
jgi:hypothetical protein